MAQLTKEEKFAEDYKKIVEKHGYKIIPAFTCKYRFIKPLADKLVKKIIAGTIIIAPKK